MNETKQRLDTEFVSCCCRDLEAIRALLRSRRRADIMVLSFEVVVGVGVGLVGWAGQEHILK